MGIMNAILASTPLEAKEAFSGTVERVGYRCHEGARDKNKGSEKLFTLREAPSKVFHVTGEKAHELPIAMMVPGDRVSFRYQTTQKKIWDFENCSFAERKR